MRRSNSRMEKWKNADVKAYGSPKFTFAAFGDHGNKFSKIIAAPGDHLQNNIIAAAPQGN